MPCNCGKQGREKIAMTSAEATALMGNQLQGYQVEDSTGEKRMYEQYIDAKIDAVRSGGRLSEVRG